MNKLFKVIYEGMDNPNFKNKYACKYGSFHIERVYEMTMEIFNEHGGQYLEEDKMGCSGRVNLFKTESFSILIVSPG